MRDFFLIQHAVKTCVNGVQKNHLMETVVLSTHNICFGRKMKKIFLFVCLWLFCQSFQGLLFSSEFKWKLFTFSLLSIMASKCLESPAHFYDTNVGGRAVPLAAAFWEMVITFGLLSECNLLKLRQFGLGFRHFKQSPSFSASPSCKHPDNDLNIIDWDSKPLSTMTWWRLNVTLPVITHLNWPLQRLYSIVI